MQRIPHCVEIFVGTCYEHAYHTKDPWYRPFIAHQEAIQLAIRCNSLPPKKYLKLDFSLGLIWGKVVNVYMSCVKSNGRPKGLYKEYLTIYIKKNFGKIHNWREEKASSFNFLLSSSCTYEFINGDSLYDYE